MSADVWKDTQSRAPLGNKTTNAKARTGQTGGVKGLVKKLEKSQLQPTTQKRKPLSLELGPLEFKAKPEQKALGEEEPEYAPSHPEDRHYESDIYADDMLGLEGMHGGTMLKGYQWKFEGSVVPKAAPQQDKQTDDSIKKTATKASDRNQHEAGMNWNHPPSPDYPPRQPKTHLVKREPSRPPSRLVRKQSTKQPSTIASRRAASALSMTSDSSKSTSDVALAIRPKTRKPPSTMFRGKTPMAATKTSAAESAAGEAASRTTIGYSRGRVASSMMQSQRRVLSDTAQPAHAVRPSQSLESFSTDMTITPARMRQANYLAKQDTRPSFTFLFEEESDDDEDAVAIGRPLLLSDDEEDFRLGL